MKLVQQKKKELKTEKYCRFGHVNDILNGCNSVEKQKLVENIKVYCQECLKAKLSNSNIKKKSLNSKEKWYIGTLFYTPLLPYLSNFDSTFEVRVAF